MRFSPLLLACVSLLSFTTPAFADAPKPDDTVSFELSAEDWVTTKTAHVTLGVEAAVKASDEGDLRADMLKAVNSAAKADWKETGFNRSQDQTGMERWSVMFDARLEEDELNGLADKLKKESKAGMQVSIANVDFSPTLEEMESARAALRAHILKEANEQLAALNTALPERGYRISEVTFSGGPVVMPRMMHKTMMALAASAPVADEPPEQHAQKLGLNAHIVYAAPAPFPASASH